MTAVLAVEQGLHVDPVIGLIYALWWLAIGWHGCRQCDEWRWRRRTHDIRDSLDALDRINRDKQP